jgi:hypothetical protein
MSALLCLVWTMGCGEEFAPASLVDGLRVLAIEASPPTIECDVSQTFKDLAAGRVEELSCSETSELQALVHSSGDIQWKWSACLFDTTSSNAFACADEALECCLSEEPTASFSLASLMLAIGSGQCADGCTGSAEAGTSLVLTDSGREDLARELAVIGDALHKSGALIRLVVTSGGAKVEAVKSVRFSSGETSNANPVIASVMTNLQICEEPDADGLCESTEEAVLEVAPKQTVRFILSVTEDSLEDHVDFLGESAREEMQVFWFATSGEITAESSFGQPAETKWVAPLASEWLVDSPIQLWFVVRDGRGGVTWTTRTMQRSLDSEESG